MEKVIGGIYIYIYIQVYDSSHGCRGMVRFVWKAQCLSIEQELLLYTPPNSPPQTRPGQGGEGSEHHTQRGQLISFLSYSKQHGPRTFGKKPKKKKLEKKIAVFILSGRPTF